MSRLAEIFTAQTRYDGDLSFTAYMILTLAFLGIIGGLGWCFYRAIKSGNSNSEPQLPDDIGDEK